MNRKSAPLGFTLIELLTVIAILAVLGGMLLPMLGKVRAQAESTKCASNLHQIGAGILAYANDNNQTLPGPLKIGVYSYSWGGDPAALSTHIWSYVGMDKDNQRKKTKDVMICPLYDRGVRGDYSRYPAYMLNAKVRMRDDDQFHQPFGAPWQVIPGTRLPSQEFTPMKIVRLADICDDRGVPAPSAVWAIKDADAWDDLMKPSPYRDLLPQSMIHGTHRNALFFDFHVGRVDRDNKPL